MARGVGRTAWNHKALLSPKPGRRRDAPPPPPETHWGFHGKGETQPMLPARSALPPGPDQGCYVLLQKDQTVTEKGGRESFRARFFKGRNRAKDSNVEGLPPFIQRYINYCACRHSGGSRNPAKNWMPDQVRHDKPIRFKVAMYISQGNHG
jgi:hypothetical protein